MQSSRVRRPHCDDDLLTTYEGFAQAGIVDSASLWAGSLRSCARAVRDLRKVVAHDRVRIAAIRHVLDGLRERRIRQQMTLEQQAIRIWAPWPPGDRKSVV